MYFLLKYKKENKFIFGYGAAAKGNTLLNYCEIKSNLLPFVCDKAISKQGKYLPGSHIPIINPEELKKYKNGTMFLLPWNLIEEIRKDFDHYDIVTAIPKLKITKSYNFKN